MALVLANRVQETGTANTTVSFTLAGAVQGFQTFATVGDTNTTYYSATDASGNWEVGLGTYSTTGPTLTRTTVYASSNSGLAVTFSGTVNVFLTYPSGRSVNLDASGNVSALGTVASGTWQGSTVGVAYGGTGVTTSSGANSVVLRDSNQNITVNRISQGTQTVTAAGGTTILTAASQFNQTLTGTGGQTYRLPDATTLTDTTTFQFNNNATGTLTITDYASATIGTVAPGGAAGIALLSNATTGGTWDVHAYIPENVTWGTNSLALGSTVITGGTWNGGTITSGYGGTGLTTFASANNALYSTSASALAAGTLPVAAGGTASTTAQGAMNTFAGAVTSGSYLRGNGTNVVMSTIQAADVPTLNQNTTGTAAGLSSTLVATSGGTGQSSYAVGDILYASTTTALSKLADVATGNALISGGVGVAPSYGKIGLTTHVSGTLPVANGGTGATTLTGYVYGNGTGAFTASTSIPNSATTATSANTASAIVARDASGNFSAGTITATLSGNASTATTATTANALNSSNNYSVNQLLNNTWYNYNDNDRNAGSATYYPNASTRAARFFFASASTTGTGGNYAGVLQFNPWDGTTASTGDASYQFAFGSTAANGGGIPQLNIRKGIDTTWNSWYTLLHSGNYNSYAPTLTGTGASGTWGINVTGSSASCTGNAATATALQTSRTINGTSFNGTADIIETEWIHSNRDFVNGTLITTNINYAVSSGDPFVLEIGGNSYGSLLPFDIQLQGYIYADTIINYGGHSTGPTFSIIAMNVGGNLCFWFARQAYWQGFNVKAYAAYATRAINRVTSITDVANPGGTKQVTFNPVQVLRSDNYSSYSNFSGAVYGTIYYDANNSGYYVNPNSASQFSSVYADNWFRPQGGTGVYWESYGRGIRAADNEFSYGNIGVYGGGLNGWTGYGVYPNNCILMANGSNWGVYNPSYGWMLYSNMSGALQAPSFAATSDMRTKQNIREIDEVVKRRDVLAMAAIKYEKDGFTQIGYGAQILRDNGCGEFVEEADDERKIVTGLGTLTVDYGQTAAVLAVASKMTDDRVAQLEAKVAQLEALVEKLLGERNAG